MEERAAQSRTLLWFTSALTALIRDHAAFPRIAKQLLLPTHCSVVNAPSEA